MSLASWDEVRWQMKCKQRDHAAFNGNILVVGGWISTNDAGTDHLYKTNAVGLCNIQTGGWTSLQHTNEPQTGL